MLPKRDLQVSRKPNREPSEVRRGLHNQDPTDGTSSCSRQLLLLDSRHDLQEFLVR